MMQYGPLKLGPWTKKGRLNVLIETPKGSRNKFKFVPDSGLYELSGVLPVGASFPFDFGFVPGTQGEDGDPLDVLLLMDEPVFTGCMVGARLIGVIKAEQTEGKKTSRNDRLIAVAEDSRLHEDIRSLDGVGDALLEEIEHFFESYNELKGKTFKLLGRAGPRAAKRLIEDGIKKRPGRAGKTK